MTRRENDLFESYVSGGMSRRDLVHHSARLGLGAAAAAFLLNAAGTKAMAADFDWKKFSGKPVRLLLNKHPYTDALVANLPNFKGLTGIDVTHQIFPEDVYFDKVDAALQAKSSDHDVFMTGAYQTWQYGPAGTIVDLNEFLKDPALTAASYHWDDVQPNLRSALAWSGVVGDPLGGPGAKQLALPLGAELNSLSFNARILKQMGVEAPHSLPDLVEKATKISAAGGGIYGVGVRGTSSWATIHPGYLSAFANYGASDFVLKDGKLQAAMNSPQAKEMTKLWVAMIQKGGPKNWRNCTWYEISNDLSAGRSAMIYDADILGYFANLTGKEAGNIAFDGFTPNPAAKMATPNVWIWSIAMSSFSKQRTPAWYFMQWATGTENADYGANKANLMDPVRKSVWDNAEFAKNVDAKAPSYMKQYNEISGGAKIYFTPQPAFFDVTTQWAESLRKMVASAVPVDEGLDALAASLTEQLNG